MSISDQYAEELGKQIEELEKENGHLRAALLVARKWMPGSVSSAYTKEAADEVKLVDTAIDMSR